jgi:hypothetical protein
LYKHLSVILDSTMELATLTALAVTVTSVIFQEAIKETGKNLGKGTSELVGKLLNVVSEKFKEKKTEGLLPSPQTQPDEGQKQVVQQMLQTYMSQDQAFTATLNQLLEELKSKQVIEGGTQIGIEKLRGKGNIDIGEIVNENKNGSGTQKGVSDIEAGKSIKIKSVKNTSSH